MHLDLSHNQLTQFHLDSVFSQGNKAYQLDRLYLNDILLVELSVDVDKLPNLWVFNVKNNRFNSTQLVAVEALRRSRIEYFEVDQPSCS